MRDRLIKALIEKNSYGVCKDNDLQTTGSALEVTDSKFASQILLHSRQYNSQALACLKSGDLIQALKFFNEAARTYSKITPISFPLASCYIAIADIYNKPGDQYDIVQALNYYKNALKICIFLLCNCEINTTLKKDLYIATFKCNSKMGAIYYQIGAAHDCEIGTPFDYDLCLMSDDTKIKYGKLYLAREKGEIVYWVMTKNEKLEKGTIDDSIPIPIPFTIANLNSSKKKILEMTSKASLTRVYDKTDAEYAQKMKEKAINRNKIILHNYIKQFGLTNPLIAACYEYLGNLYRSIKQEKIANYFFENASCLHHLKKIIEAAPPLAYSITHATCTRIITEKGLAFDAAVLSAFIAVYGEKNGLTAKCCAGIGTIYHFIGREAIATDFFDQASKMTLLENKNLYPANESIEKMTVKQSGLKKLTEKPDKIELTPFPMTPKNSAATTKKRKKKPLFNTCKKKEKETFTETEEKKTSTVLFNSNTLFSKTANASGRFYNGSFINTSRATFSEDTSPSQEVTTSNTGIFGFLKRINLEKKPLLTPNRTGVLEFLEESNQNALNQHKNLTIMNPTR